MTRRSLLVALVVAAVAAASALVALVLGRPVRRTTAIAEVVASADAMVWRLHRQGRADTLLLLLRDEARAPTQNGAGGWVVARHDERGSVLALRRVESDGSFAESVVTTPRGRRPARELTERRGSLRFEGTAFEALRGNPLRAWTASEHGAANNSLLAGLSGGAGDQGAKATAQLELGVRLGSCTPTDVAGRWRSFNVNGLRTGTWLLDLGSIDGWVYSLAGDRPPKQVTGPARVDERCLAAFGTDDEHVVHFSPAHGLGIGVTVHAEHGGVAALWIRHDPTLRLERLAGRWRTLRLDPRPALGWVVLTADGRVSRGTEGSRRVAARGSLATDASGALVGELQREPASSDEGQHGG